jgi:DNA-directed RNA polymerase specialized sigma24 family protein
MAYHIGASARNDRKSQKLIYSYFYDYAMAICYQYASSPNDAVEILNEGFLSIFKEIHHCKPDYTGKPCLFKSRLGEIMVNTARDYLIKNQENQSLACDPGNFEYSPPMKFLRKQRVFLSRLFMFLAHRRHPRENV